MEFVENLSETHRLRILASAHSIVLAIPFQCMTAFQASQKVHDTVNIKNRCQRPHDTMDMSNSCFSIVQWFCISR